MNRDPDGYFTPAYIADIVREAMGGAIDLDPASCEAANELVKAKHFYAKAENGLKQPWFGNVFLAPPQSGRQLEEWTVAVIQSFNQQPGGCNQAIMMLSDRQAASSAYMLRRGAAIFNWPTVITCYAANGTDNVTDRFNFFYFGDSPERFLDIFSKASVTPHDDTP